MKGIALNFDITTDEGLISGEDGKRYIFTSQDWQDKIVFPQARLTVDFVIEGQKALSIYSIPAQSDDFSDNTDFFNDVSDRNILLKQILGFSGSILMFLGVFAPVISVPVMGNLNYFQNGKGSGVFLLIFALASFVLMLLKRYKLLWFTGLGSLLILIYTFILLQVKISEVKSELESQLAGNPFRSFADVAVQSVQLQWGWPLLLIATFMLFSSAAISEDGTISISGLMTSFQEAIELLIKQLKKLKPLEWLILSVMVALLLFGSSYFLNQANNSNPEVVRARESETRAKETEAKSMVGAINRNQQAYHFENNKFASTLSQLDIPIVGKYYEKYDMVAESSDFVFTKTQPITANQELHSFAGAVFYNQEGRSFESKICRSDEPYKEINAPTIVAGAIVCGSGSSEI